VPALIAGDFNESESGSAWVSLRRHGFRSAVPEFGDAETWCYATSLGWIYRRFDHIVYDGLRFPCQFGSSTKDDPTIGP
jgi:hypothetical protein